MNVANKTHLPTDKNERTGIEKTLQSNNANKTSINCAVQVLLFFVGIDCS